MKTRRWIIAALHDDAFSIAYSGMAWHTVNVVPLLPTPKDSIIHLEWKPIPFGTIDQSRIEVASLLQLGSRHCA